MLVIDAHCDTLLKYSKEKGLFDLGTSSHLDLKRLAESVSLQFFAVFIPSQFRPHQVLPKGLEMIDSFLEEMERCRNQIQLVRKKSDLLPIGANGQSAALLTLEGGDMLCGNLSFLRILFRLGLRSVCLTWNNRNEIADGVGETAGGGLTAFGRELIMEMNRLGMVVDLAHISEKGFWSAMEVCSRPLIVSHANCKALCDHRRNLTDAQIKAVAAKKGVMGISFVPGFLAADGKATINHVIDHIDYACQLVGTDYVGLGSDFDGTDLLPEGLHDVRSLPSIAEGLIKRGYQTADIEKIMGRNFFSLLYEVLPER